MRVVCLHGHFYQPPREHPWLGVVGPEASAAPDRDWNSRITRECYGPMANARLLDHLGRLCDLINVYDGMTFDFGPTLLSWLAPFAPDVMAAVRAADSSSRRRTGHGSAWAQPYTHAILPLSRPDDLRTQVWWGRRDFEFRFGAAPEGMWLPEMAVDHASLCALAEAGINLTMLAPHQARRTRPLGASDDAWRPVTPQTLDTRRLYRCLLPSGQSIDIVFREPAISQELAFGELLRDGAALVERVRRAVLSGEDGTILAAAVDGETFGHHHRFGEMALAFAMGALVRDPEIRLAGPGAFRDAHPPTDEIEIVDGTSWSCPHGIERWRSDCGCKTGGPADWSQAWRAPLRTAIDWLRDELAIVFQTRASECLRDPPGARDRYIDCVLEPGRIAKFLSAEASSRLSPAATVHARRCLELARHALLMQTSCGWFFDDLAGLEGMLILRQAARAIDLGDSLGRRLEDGFCDRLATARSNRPEEGSGADVYRRAAGSAATPARVAATAALLQLLEHPPRVPGFDVTLTADPVPEGLVGEARVVELATGSALGVPFKAAKDGAGAPSCRIGEATFVLSDLFGVQRAELLERVGEGAAATARGARHAAITTIRPVIDGLFATVTPLPTSLALLLGYEEAEVIAHTVRDRTVPIARLVPRAGELKSRGLIFPARWLADELQRTLEERLACLPTAADDAVALLDLAEAASLTLDLRRAQVLALQWWKREADTAETTSGVTRLLARLNVAWSG